MKAVVVIPTYNERRNVSVLIPRLAGALRKGKVNGRIIVVDDGSKDGTDDEVLRLSKKYSVELLERHKRMGLGSAYVAGFNRALSYKPYAVVEMDADLSHDPNFVPRLLDAIAAGCDVAIGSRYIKGGKTIGWSMHRKLVSFFANIVVKHIAGIRTKDATSGFRAYRSAALRRMLGHVTSKSYDFQIETTWLAEKLGMKISEIPIVFRERAFGKSKLRAIDMFSFALMALRLRISKRPS